MAKIFAVKKGGNTLERKIGGKVRFVPQWARANDDPAITKLQDPRTGILEKNFKEIEVPNAPGFLFYRGVK